MDTKEHSFGPVLDFVSNESSVLLCQRPAKVCIGETNYTGHGEVRMDLAPRAYIHLYGTFQDVMLGQIDISSFHINGLDIKGFYLDMKHVSDKTMTVKWCPESEPINGVGDALTQMNRVVFHLFNFKDIVGTRRSSEKKGTAIHAIEHIELSCDAWKVELRTLFNTRDNFKKLKSEGGYQLTHIGCLQNNDCTGFSGKIASEILDALRFFLSFVKGGWCEPVCAVGFNESGNRVWESWSSPREAWYNPSSCFDARHSSQLKLFFPGFIKHWKNTDWREALHETIYLYLNANKSSRGIDAGIILTQAAIDRLSYEYAVKTKRLLTIKGFKDLRASDRLRVLFSSLGIPIDIPCHTPVLKKLAKKVNWLDAPHALTEVRNSLVHPEHRYRGQFDSAFYEAWNLWLWYLEMSILRICGFSGTYSNRLVSNKYVGTVEDVPWTNYIP